MSTELTDSHARQWGSVTGEKTLSYARREVKALQVRGWTIEPPEPRYVVNEAASAGGWVVCDNEDTDSNDHAKVVASYWSDHPDPRGRARAEADRLNREDT